MTLAELGAKIFTKKAMEVLSIAAFSLTIGFSGGNLFTKRESEFAGVKKYIATADSSNKIIVQNALKKAVEPILDSIATIRTDIRGVKDMQNRTVRSMELHINQSMTQENYRDMLEQLEILMGLQLQSINEKKNDSPSTILSATLSGYVPARTPVFSEAKLK